MKRYAFMLLGVVFLFFTIQQARALDGLKEGKWSMTLVTKMDNMSPEMIVAMKKMENLPPEAQAAMKRAQAKYGLQMNADGGMTITHEQCITNQNPIPKQAKEMSGCQSTHTVDGNTINFHTVCDHENFQFDSSGSVIYSGDSMQGHIKNHQVYAGRVTDSSIDVTGQYVGPCQTP